MKYKAILFGFVLLTSTFLGRSVNAVIKCEITPVDNRGKCSTSGGCAVGQMCATNFFGQAACQDDTRCCKTDSDCNTGGRTGRFCETQTGICAISNTTYRKVGQLCTNTTTCCADVIETERGAQCIGTSLCPIGLPPNQTTCSTCLPIGADTSNADTCCTRYISRGVCAARVTCADLNEPCGVSSLTGAGCCGEFNLSSPTVCKASGSGRGAGDLSYTCQPKDATVVKNGIGGSCADNSNCQTGLICDNNICVSSTTIGRYTGPLSSFTELLKSAYTLLYPIGLGIGAFFILLSGYCFMTSEGEPQAIKGCQEQFTGAIAGTLFILLSITLLRVIIGSILGVPGGF